MNVLALCRYLILILLSSTEIAFAANHIAWLIHPSAKNSPAIELSTKEGLWRLLGGDRTLLVEMKAPPLKKGYVLNFGDCRIEGVLRHDFVAMVRHKPGREWSPEVFAIWIADPEKKKFRRQPGKGVECRNELYGI